MRLFRGPCHYGRELLPDLPFGWRELFTRGIIWAQRKLGGKTRHYDYCGSQASTAIENLIRSEKPCFVSRFGTGEFEATQRGHDILASGNAMQKAFRILVGKSGPFWWDNSILAGISYNAGVFPCSKEIALSFAKQTLSDAREIDLLGKYQEAKLGLIPDNMPSAKLIPLTDLEPFWLDSPWTKALKNKGVLIIHSMPHTIEKQYAKRHELFTNPNILPDFILSVYGSVNSAIGLKTPFANWFDALEKMKSDIARIDFDIAILGCGSYGMSLGAFIKRDLGKKAVHLGGMTQLLFGIRGKRWDSDPKYARLVTPAWTRPLPDDTPAASNTIEGGCYW